MKNILVPTDFSDCAGYALEFAYCMSSIYDSDIVLFHNIHDKKGIWKSKKNDDDPGQKKEEIEKILNVEFERLLTKTPIRRDKIKTAYDNGDLVENINKAIDQYNIDFVVMGSHGASGKREFFIGSNTQKVVRAIHHPVFIVKNSVKDYKIDRVVFASDFKLTELKSLKYALKFLEPFKPVIHLVEINTPSFFNLPEYVEKEVLEDFKALCSGFECHTHYIKDNSVDAGVRNITTKLEADMIIVSNQNRHPIKQMLRGSSVEFIINHAEVPVLSIDSEDR